MDRKKAVGLALLLAICISTGCSKGDSGAPAAGSPNTTGSTPADPTKDPIARAAYEFLDAVLKGDTQRASAQLTPVAMQRIVEGGKQFQPPGLESASFRIGEVRAPSDSQALVQCILTNNTTSGQQTEEMCCLMRRVDNQWRVSGIACSVGNDKPPMILDFENPPQDPPQQQQPMVQQQPVDQQPAAAIPGYAPVGRPSPPRTAQEQQVPPAVR